MLKLQGLHTATCGSAYTTLFMYGMYGKHTQLCVSTHRWWPSPRQWHWPWGGCGGGDPCEKYPFLADNNVQWNYGWETTLRTDHPDQRPLWWQTTPHLMPIFLKPFPCHFCVNEPFTKDLSSFNHSTAPTCKFSGWKSAHKGLQAESLPDL